MDVTLKWDLNSSWCLICLKGISLDGIWGLHGDHILNKSGGGKDQKERVWFVLLQRFWSLSIFCATQSVLKCRGSVGHVVSWDMLVKASHHCPKQKSMFLCFYCSINDNHVFLPCSPHMARCLPHLRSCPDLPCPDSPKGSAHACPKWLSCGPISLLFIGPCDAFRLESYGYYA